MTAGHDISVSVLLWSFLDFESCRLMKLLYFQRFVNVGVSVSVGASVNSLAVARVKC